LEPRRLAARLAARRAAEEMGERLGETVGYQVRFDEVAGPKTRLRFLTEGVLTRRLLDEEARRSEAWSRRLCITDKYSAAATTTVISPSATDTERMRSPKTS
jgi:hypothetical protein